MTHDVRLWCVHLVVLPPERLSLWARDRIEGQRSLALHDEGSRRDQEERVGDARFRFLATRPRTGAS